MNRVISILSLFILSAMYMISQYIYFNPTNSEIKGYYWVYQPKVYKVNDLVLVCIRDIKSIELLHQLGLPYIETQECNIPFLLKKIVAIEGDIFAVDVTGIRINNFLYPNTQAITKYQNTQLNPLAIGTKYQLESGEYFLLGQGSNSYDSRYFGVIHRSDLRYRAILIWQRNKLIW
jgi:conjugative transfer signal peptidase TraF